MSSQLFLDWFKTDGGRIKPCGRAHKYIQPDEELAMIEAVRSCSTLISASAKLGIHKSTLCTRLKRTKNGELLELAMSKGMIRSVSDRRKKRGEVQP